MSFFKTSLGSLAEAGAVPAAEGEASAATAVFSAVLAANSPRPAGCQALTYCRIISPIFICTDCFLSAVCSLTPVSVISVTV